jgi:hypothetical protein
MTSALEGMALIQRKMAAGHSHLGKRCDEEHTTSFHIPIYLDNTLWGYGMN